MASHRQLSLPFLGRAPRRVPAGSELAARAQALADGLERRLGERVRLIVTDNRTSLVSVRPEKDVWVYRVHHLFLGAPEELVDALAWFAQHRRKKTTAARIDGWIDQHAHLIRSDPAAGPRAPAPPKGAHHDLQAIFDRLNDEYFGGRIAARIGWGPRRRRRRGRRQSIKMGTYVHDARLIRIHPALDRAEVPEFYVAWVVYHEMLHQVVPPVRKGRRNDYHPPEFRRLEALYAEVEEAQRWEESNWQTLLRD